MRKDEDPLQVLQRCEREALGAITHLIERPVRFQGGELGLVVDAKLSPGLFLLEVRFSAEYRLCRLDQLQPVPHH